MKLFGSKAKGWSAAVNAIGKAESMVQLGKDGGASYGLHDSGKPRTPAQQAAVKKAGQASAAKRRTIT